MNLTIVVPTKNRSSLLRSCLEFIRGQNSVVEIIVADSSGESEREINRKTIAGLGPGIRCFEFDGGISPVEKVSLAIDQVATRYACMCADDDLIVVKSALKCAEFLERNSEYVACHGNYLRFSIGRRNAMVLEDWEYRGPSLTGETPAARTIDLLANYEALTYSVQATPTLRQSIEAMKTSPYNMHLELANGLWLALSGKVKRLDDLYYFRQAGDATVHSFSEPYTYLAKRFPTMFSEYAAMATALIEKFGASHKGKIEDGLFDVLCFGFLVYLYKSIDLIDLARLMIPQIPKSDLKRLATFMPPTLHPTPGILAKAFVKERIRFMQRGMRYLRRKLTPVTDQENRLRDTLPRAAHP